MRNEVVSRLAEANAISPNDIWLILQSSGMIGLSESGDVLPLNSASGEPLLSGSGKPMDLKTFIEGYLSDLSETKDATLRRVKALAKLSNLSRRHKSNR